MHQSNGQSLPLSRSWNRAYLMTGMELDNRWAVNARLWKRIGESASSDDNPDISDYIGRGELSAFWNMDKDNTLGLTLRSSLNSSPAARRGWNGCRPWAQAWAGARATCVCTPSCSRLWRQHDRLQPQAHRVHRGAQSGGFLTQGNIRLRNRCAIP